MLKTKIREWVKERASCNQTWDVTGVGENPEHMSWKQKEEKILRMDYGTINAKNWREGKQEYKLPLHLAFRKPLWCDIYIYRYI